MVSANRLYLCNHDMEYRTLGKSGLKVSAVGLGCMDMSHTHGIPANRLEMKALLADTVDMGYTFFDTANGYGTADRLHDNEVPYRCCSNSQSCTLLMP